MNSIKFQNWFKRQYTYQNFVLNWTILDKLHKIQDNSYENVIEYISPIKNVSAKIKDLKISIFEILLFIYFIILIYTFGITLQFWATISKKKRKTVKIMQTNYYLENELMSFLNKCKKMVNYICSSKLSNVE